MMYITLSTLLVLLSVSFGRFIVTAQKPASNVQLLRNNNRSLQTVVGKVDQLILYNAITDLPLLTLTDGMVVNIATLNVNTGSLTVVATTIDGAVGSVKFGYNGKKTQKNEILAPYSLCGDKGADFEACSYLVVGQHTLTVTTYEGVKFNGTIGSVEKLSFQIVNIPPTMAPTKTPTTEPIISVATGTPTGTPLKIPTNVPIIAPLATIQPSVLPTKTPTKPPTSAPIVEVSCSIPKFSTDWQGFSPDYPIHTPEAQAERIGNDLIAFGGFNSAFTSATNQSYARDISIPNSRWRRMDDMPIATGITHAATVVIGTKMYMCGGYEGRPPGPHVANCFIYDHAKAPGSGQWSNFTPLPNNGSAGGGMIYDTLRNALYYSGGAQRPKRGSRVAYDQNHTWKFSFDNPTAGWVESSPIPYTANHQSCVTVRYQGQDRHFFAGGQIGENEKYGNVADTVEFVASTETWVRRTSMPYARSHTTTSMRAIGCGFIIGGGSINSPHDRLQRTNEILYYDVPSDSWTFIGKLPVQVATPKMYIDDNKLLYYIDSKRSNRLALST